MPPSEWSSFVLQLRGASHIDFSTRNVMATFGGGGVGSRDVSISNHRGNIDNCRINLELVISFNKIITKGVLNGPHNT